MLEEHVSSEARLPYLPRLASKVQGGRFEGWHHFSFLASLFSEALTLSVKCTMVPPSRGSRRSERLKGATPFSIMSFTTSEAKEVSHEGLDSWHPQEREQAVCL